MKSNKQLGLLAGLLLGIFATVPARGATTIVSDNYNTTTNGTGFGLDAGINSGINPPITRITGTAAANLRYYPTATGKSASQYDINNNRLHVTKDATSAIGRFTLSTNGTNAFSFAPVLQTAYASATNPVTYDIKIGMRNDAVNSSRFSFGIATAEGDVTTWDFGVQLYRGVNTDDFYNIRKRLDTNSIGMADVDAVMTTTAIGTYKTLIAFLIRVTDAGAESGSAYNSRVQVSIDNGSSWIYDTKTDSTLTNGFRFDGANRIIVWDQAGNTSGDVFYDNFSIAWNSGPRAWDGGGANINWNNATNWGGAVPVSGSPLIFSGTTQQFNSNNINNLSIPSITFSNGGFVINGNALTITNAITNVLGDNTLSNAFSLANPLRLQATAGTLTLAGAISGSGQNLTIAGAGNTTITGAIGTGAGTVTKQDGGTLSLGGTNTYTGTTTVSAGTLALVGSGSIGSSSSIVVAAGASLDATGRTDQTLALGSSQILSGNGTLTGTLSLSGTLSPGSSIGTLTTGSETWNSGGQLNCEINNTTGAAGTDWDAVIVNGTLDIQASRLSPFVINLSGAASASFDNTGEYTWDIVTTTGGIVNFDAARIIVNAPGFDKGANGGFGVKVSGNTLQVFFGETPTIAINNAAKTAGFGDPNYSFGGEGNDFTTTSSSPIVAYQWRKNGSNVANDSNISGATTPTLTFAQVRGADAGNYSIAVWNSAGSTVSSDITLTVTKADQHVVASAIPEANYGDSVTLGNYFVAKDNADVATGSPLTYSLDSGASIASINSGILTFNDVGTVTIRATAQATLDYNTSADVTGNATAGTRTLTVTPVPASKSYGDTNPAFAFSYSGFAFTETLATSGITGTETVTASCPADGTSIPGDYTVTVDPSSLTGLASSHYDFSTATGTLTVTNRALKLVAASVGKTFGDIEPTLTWTTNGFVNGDENLDLGGGLTVLTGTPVVTRAVGENAGSYVISVDTNGVTVNTNLYVLQAQNGTFTINKATPTVNVVSLTTEVYNGSGHPTTGSVTGVSGADLGSAMISYNPGAASAPVNAGDYEVTGSFGGNGNYNSAVGTGTVHIATATVSPVITAADKTYNGTAGATISSYGLTGVFGTDDVSLTGGSASFTSPSVGVNKTVNATGLSLTGSAAGNYQLSSSAASALASITPASVVPQITANNKTYDAGVSATIASRSLSGVVGTDDVSLTGGTATFESASVGTAKTVNVTGLSLAGSDSGNYQLASTSTTTTADIAAATLTPLITAENKTYDGGVTATIATRSLTGVIGSEDVSLTGGSATFTSAAVGTGKSVSATGLALAGTDISNYELSSTEASTTADITPATVTPQVAVANKTYDGTTSAVITSRNLTGVLNSDDVTLSGGTAIFESASAGTGKTVTVTGLSLAGTAVDNYQLSSTSANTTADITKATPIITWGPLPQIAVGTSLASSLNAQADQDGSFTYAEGLNAVNSGTLLPVGTHTLTASFIPIEAGNYNVASLDQELVVTGIPDTNKPILKVLSPLANFGYRTNAGLPSLLIKGTSIDTERVASVQYDFNNAGYTNADMVYVGLKKPTNWSSTITLVPGTNTLKVRTFDLAGNGVTNALTFYYHTVSPLTIIINGTGSVGNATSPSMFVGNNTNLFVGRTYSLSTFIGAGTNQIGYVLTNVTYTAAGGQSGELFVNSNALPKNLIKFMMRSNMVITFNFLNNPLLRHGGTYNGLFFNTNNVVERGSAGYLNLIVTPKWTYSGKMYLHGNIVPVKGKLLINGTGATTSSRAKFGYSDVSLNFAVDFATESDTLTGSVASAVDSWTSHLDADKFVWTTNVNETAAAWTNSYTLAIPGFGDKTQGPPGYGYVSAKVDLKGGIIPISGYLADGTVMKFQVTKVSKNGDWPFYASLQLTNRTVTYNSMSLPVKEGTTTVIGWLHLATNGPGSLAPTNLAPQGDLTWIKTGYTNLYTSLTKTVTITGSRLWIPPTAGTPFINQTNLIMTFSDGDLIVPLVATNYTLTGLNTVKPPLAAQKTANAAITIAAKIGTITGSFMRPSTTTVVKHFGIVLQDYKYGRGFFVGTTEGGMTTLSFNP